MNRFALAIIWVPLLLIVLSGCSSLEDSMDALPDKRKPLASHYREPDILSERNIPYEMEIVASKLDVPWALDLSPDGRIFFTERPGTIRVMDGGKLLPAPVFSLDSPFVSEGEGGLLGLVLDPHFQENHYMYAYHSYQEKGQIKNRVIRLVEENNRAAIDTILIDNIPGDRHHNGGRLKIGPDGCLYITTGDALSPDWALDPNRLAGKILRIHLDGSIPEDNPFPGSPVYSSGHRNPQGLAWHPLTGSLYSSEHGQAAHDEINLILPGGNYGWPEIQGDQRDGRNRYQLPILHSGHTTWAPSGMAFITQGPWKDQLLVGQLRGQHLLKLALGQPDEVQSVSEWNPSLGRIRDLAEGPDGSIYLITNNRDGRGQPIEEDDRMIRLKFRHP